MRRPVAASAAQQGVWFTEQVGGAGSAYHLPLAIRFDGRLDVPALAGACEAVVDRHPPLACAIEERRGAPFLVAAAVRPRVERVDVPAGPALDDLVRREILRPFDLGRGPLVRFTLCALGPERHLLLVVAHHVVFDGGSKDVLVRDLVRLYEARAGGAAVALPPVPAWGDLAEEQRRRLESGLAAAEEHWSQRWGSPEGVTLPGLLRQVTGVEPGDSVGLDVDGLSDALDGAVRALGASRFELLLTALLALLHRYGNDPAVVAVDLSTRTDAGRDSVGFFVNELPLSVPRLPGRTFADLLGATRIALHDLSRVRDVPLARAVPGIGPRTAVAPVSVSYRRREDAAGPRFAGVAASVDWMPFNHAARGTLRVQVVDGPGSLAGSLQFSPDALDRRSAERVAGHLATLLGAALSSPAAPVARLPLLDGPERAWLVDRCNRTAVDGGVAATVPALFEAQVARTPAAPALVLGDRTLTYAELDAASGRLAARLRGDGVGRGALVAVCAERSAELVVGLLAVLRAGAAYVPLDPAHPMERLRFVLGDAGTGWLMTQRRLLDRLPEGAGRVLLLDDAAEPVAEPAAGPGRAAGPGDLAYVIYTSGSTGRPKGVEIEHRSLANVLRAIRGVAGGNEGDAWLAATSPSFDIAALELFLPLVTGGRVVVAGEDAARDGGALVDLMRQHAVTHAQATPSGWRLLLDAGFDEPGVTALCGGEALPPALARELRGRVGRLLNVYGPTETTVWSTAAEVPLPVAGVTIGAPVANTRVHLVDENVELVPVGIGAELCIGGEGVGRGYRRRAALTAERFVPDPFGPPGARLYRTGDRAVRLPDGSIEFLGRVDGQVKILGHRVELGEIEAALLEHPGVVRAAVALRHGPERDPRLVAYLVPREGSRPEPAELRGHLGRVLPDHMVPRAFVELERLPLTPNGKLDRAALPEPPRPREEAGERRPEALTGLVRDVRDICCEVMKLDDIQPDESLFELGGHSLTMTMIASRIRKRLRMRLPLHVFYDEPTISGIVHALTAGQSAPP
jgi:amino acid adenylation domain-containing protein